jgi:hypothetical protein
MRVPRRWGTRATDGDVDREAGQVFSGDIKLGRNEKLASEGNGMTRREEPLGPTSMNSCDTIPVPPPQLPQFFMVCGCVVAEMIYPFSFSPVYSYLLSTSGSESLKPKNI